MFSGHKLAFADAHAMLARRRTSHGDSMEDDLLISPVPSFNKAGIFKVPRHDHMKVSITRMAEEVSFDAMPLDGFLCEPAHC